MIKIIKILKEFFLTIFKNFVKIPNMSASGKDNTKNFARSVCSCGGEGKFSMEMSEKIKFVRKHELIEIAFGGGIATIVFTCEP
jgi:hypothetical protein